ncbi:hypothetical protein [Cytobacillus sp. FSL R5-0377]|nr:hypothetical protein [Cytobacillus sp. AMY 15.2]
MNKQTAQQMYYYSGQGKPDSKMIESESKKSKPEGKQVKKLKPLFSPKGDSAPFIFTPPKLEDRQVSRNKRNPLDSILDDGLIAQPKPKKENGQILDKKSVSIPKSLMTMLTPFSPMLSWSPSLPSKFTNKTGYKDIEKNGQPGYDHYSKENTLPIQNSINALDKAEISLFEKRTSAFDEDKRDTSFLQHEKQLDLKTSSSQYEVVDLVEEFTAILETSNQTNIDVPNKEITLTNIDDPNSRKMDPQEPINEFQLSLEKGLLLNEESQDKNVQFDESLDSNNDPKVNNDRSLESEFVSMLEESSSSESDIDPSKPDQLFSVEADNSFGRSESSSFMMEKYYDKYAEFEESSSSVQEMDYCFGVHESSDEKKEILNDFDQDGSQECSSRKCDLPAETKNTSFLPLQEKLFSLMEELSYISDQVSSIISEEGISYRKYRADAENEKYHKISVLLNDFSSMMEENDYINDGEAQGVEKDNVLNEKNLMDKFTSEGDSPETVDKMALTDSEDGDAAQSEMDVELLNDKGSNLIEKFKSELDSPDSVDEMPPSIVEDGDTASGEADDEGNNDESRNLIEKFTSELDSPDTEDEMEPSIFQDGDADMGEVDDDISNDRSSNLIDKFTSELESSDTEDEMAPSIVEDGDAAPGEANDDINDDKSRNLIEKFKSELDSSDTVEEMPLSNSESSSMCDNTEEEMNEKSEYCVFEQQVAPPCRTGPIIKVPVIVAKSELEMNLFECLPVEFMVKEIKKIEWSVDSLRCRVMLPSNIAFIRAMIFAEIIYENNDTLQLAKIAIPIEHTLELCWLSPPVLPEAVSQNEYMFQAESGSNAHREFFQQFSEEICCELKKIHVVWHDTLGSGPILEIQGNAILSLDFFQEQYVKL